jgi:hypothetical protein
MNLFSKMITARIFGASDRFIIVEGGVSKNNELNATTTAGLRDGGYVGTLLLSTGREGESLHVHAFYDGYWSFAVSPADGDANPLPPWPTRRIWGKDNEHSETLEIDVPRDALLTVAERIPSR